MRVGQLGANLTARCAAPLHVEPERVDLAHGVCERSGRVDDDVSAFCALGVARLRFNAALRLPWLETALFGEALELRVAASVSDDDKVVRVLTGRFNQQRNVIDDHRIGILEQDALERQLEATLDLRVNNCLELTARIIVAEDERAKRSAVEVSVLANELSAKSARYRGKGNRTGFYRLAGKAVGVNEVSAVFDEAPSDRGFAGGDASGEAYEKHDSSVEGFVRRPGKRRTGRSATGPF